MGRGHCPSGDSGWLAGDGKCAQCHGAGINTQLDSAQTKCPYCKGTGVCSACGGTGVAGGGEHSADLIDLGL